MQQACKASISQPQCPEPFLGSPYQPADPELTKKQPEGTQKQTRPLKQHLQPLKTKRDLLIGYTWSVLDLWTRLFQRIPYQRAEGNCVPSSASAPAARAHNKWAHCAQWMRCEISSVISAHTTVNQSFLRASADQHFHLFNLRLRQEHAGPCLTLLHRAKRTKLHQGWTKSPGRRDEDAGGGKKWPLHLLLLLVDSN